MNPDQAIEFVNGWAIAIVACVVTIMGLIKTLLDAKAEITAMIRGVEEGGDKNTKKAIMKQAGKFGVESKLKKIVHAETRDENGKLKRRPAAGILWLFVPLLFGACNMFCKHDDAVAFLLRRATSNEVTAKDPEVSDDARLISGTNAKSFRTGAFMVGGPDPKEAEEKLEKKAVTSE